MLSRACATVDADGGLVFGPGLGSAWFPDGGYGLSLLWIDATFARVSEDHALLVWFKTSNSKKENCTSLCPIAREAALIP